MPDGETRRRTLERRVAEARAVLAFEAVWPAAVAALVLVALFLTLSWLGLWVASPRWLRAAGVLGFALAFAAVLWRAARRGWPGRRDALDRLDRDSGDRHRPISAGEDVLADAGAGAGTRALWALHRGRLDAALARVRVARPSPRSVDRDPYALRAAALFVAVAAAFVAGPDRFGRVAAAFAWGGDGPAAAGFRLDGWIDPPPYTGRPPIVLSGPAAPAGAAAGVENGRNVAAPVNAVVVVRSSGDGRVEVAASGALKPAPAPDAGSPAPGTADAPAAPAATTRDGARPASPAAGAVERRFILAGDGRLTVTRDGSPVADFALHAIPDRPPTIALDGPPVRNARGSLTLRYSIDDDYGAAGAEAVFSDPVVAGAKVTGRTLVEPPRIALGLPAAPRGLGKGSTTADLADSPWAGATVTMVLTARDEGGNTGTGAPSSVVLPVRAFTEPLARALVEQRRDLVLDPDHRDRIDTALDALTLAPDLFDISPPVFLGLRTAKARLDAAKTDPDLVAVADLLWSMALQIEDGDLSKAEADLKALQGELKDALARHAPPEEIGKLTEALRQQLDKFLAEMARHDASAADAQRRPGGRTRAITPRQLQSMLDRMERAAKDGDMAEAQRMLDQLRGVLDNLKTAKRRSGPERDAQRRMDRALGDLDKLTRDQQALRDQTFEDGRDGRKDGQTDDDADPQAGGPQAGDPQAGDGGSEAGQPGDGQDGSRGRSGRGQGGLGDQGQGGQGALRGRQGALRDKLGQLQKQMRDMGLEGEKGFDAANRAMRDAEGALAEGPGGDDRAVEAQGRALRGLQQGAQGLAKQMAQGQGAGEGQGQSERADGDGADGDDDGTGGPDGQKLDPLGRPRASHGVGASRDEDLGRGPGQGLAARAQQVLEELRRRLGDPSRPQAEQDYLERLLKRY